MENENMKHNDISFCDKNSRRAKYFFDEKIPVHVVTAKGSFYNGYLTEVNKNLIKIHDRKNGVMTIFLFDLKKDIVAFINKGGDNNGTI